MLPTITLFCSLASILVTPTLHSTPELALDFWVGKWECSGEMHGPKGKVTKTEAHNDVVRILGGHIIQENFKMQGFNGMSVSTYIPKTNTWKQTWVDDSGSYLLFEGGAEGDKVILWTPKDLNRPLAANRMVFENISPSSFDWNWEATSDGGKSWKLSWHLHYVREK